MLMDDNRCTYQMIQKELNIGFAAINKIIHVELQNISRPTGIVVSDADCGAVGTGLNPGEETDVCKRIVPLRQGGTINSRRAASPLVWLMEEEERWETPYIRV
ncbi:hypothetical protein TNCV_3110961 [Trichonephila clavipes]|nr:hypothetical protein TNCV_3110961 [Trichonephila clavipes]